MPGYGFPKKERLLKRWEFKKVCSRGEKVTGKFANLYILKTQPSPKAGIIISRRICNAVRRSRIKRLLREAYRLNKHIFKENIHIVFVVREDFSRMRYKDIEKEVLHLYKTAGIV